MRSGSAQRSVQHYQRMACGSGRGRRAPNWSYGRDMTTQIPTTETEWRARLNPEEFRVLRQAGTEAPWTGEYVSTRTPGMYHCRACGAELFASDTKFDSHCGWPSFYDAKPGTVKLIEDNSLGMSRTEVRCARCNSHLGHVFAGEGYDTPTDQRYCINSVSLTLEPAKAAEDAGA